MDDKTKQLLDGLTGSLGALAGAAVAAQAQVNALSDLLGAPTTSPGVVMTAATVTPNSVKVSWTSSTTDMTAWKIGRDGFDNKGSGPWETNLIDSAREFTFQSLQPATPYVFTLTPALKSGGNGTPTVLIVTTTKGDTTTPPSTGGGEGDDIAVVRGWGKPDPISDEFDYEGKPDPNKWSYCGSYGTGWPGHNGNGKRMPDNSYVKGGLLVLQGDSNGNTGWLRQKVSPTYGRWVIRSRSRTTGNSGENFHPLHLIWPKTEQWPKDGELDLLEYTDPNAKQATAWLHYPHPNMPIQQAGPFPTACDMTQFHTFAFEWDSTGVRSWIDGKPWYDVRGGAGPAGRRNIQDMPGGALTIQLDNFTGSKGLRPCLFEVEYVRFYPVK